MAESTALAHHLTHDHTFPPYKFDESLPGVPNFVRHLYNCRRKQVANNDPSEYYGDAVHNAATRFAVTRFVVENTDFGLVQKACAIECLVFTFSQNEYMGRAMASGVDLAIIQVPPKKKAAINQWLKQTQLDCPKTFADLMESVCWGAEMYAGINAVIDHYYKHLFAAFDVALRNNFAPQWRFIGENGFLRETQARWKTHHNQEPNSAHIAAFLRAFRAIPYPCLQYSFGPLEEQFRDRPSLFGADGVLYTRFLFLAYFGFSILDYYFRKDIDHCYPHYRASIEKGAHFGTLLRRIVLCDQVLAHIAGSISICTFPSKCSPQMKAQTLSAAVGRLFLENPETTELTLSLPLTTLIKMAHEVISRLDSKQMPVMPRTIPYPMVPLPYNDTPPSLPPKILSPKEVPLSTSPLRSSHSVSALVASTSASFKTKLNEVAKVLIRPFQLTTSDSREQITASPSAPNTIPISPASAIPEPNPGPTLEPLAQALHESSSKGLLSSVRLSKRPSSSRTSSSRPSSASTSAASASASTSSANLAHHPRPVQKKETVTSFRNSILKKGRLAGKSVKVPTLRRP
ncbi:hypothetical protein ONZ45_g13668 [Pleurotus djamor]|nr:hypothetical protein ONZ45_g13668 [Pleurotus djamor]